MRLPHKLLIGSALSIFAVSWRFQWGTYNHARSFHQYCGYWWMWALLIYLLYTTFSLSGPFPGLFARFSSLIIRYKGAILLILGCTLFLHVHEPHEFRVLYDEPSHLQMSQMMHLENQAMIALRSHFIGDHLLLLNPSPPFRQYFYSFLLCIGHNFFGYSTAAPFVLNALLGVFLLVAAYTSVNLIAGRTGGVVVVMLVTALPLFAQNVTSGGYDVLNLVFLAFLTVAGIGFIERPRPEADKWLNLTIAMAWGASQVRYESLVYFGGVAVLILLKRYWSKEWIITWPLCLAPLGLAPSLASNMVMMKTEAALLPSLRAPGQPFMGIQYLTSNFQDLLVYLYSPIDKGTGSVFVAVIGTIGCAFLAAQLVNKREFASPATRRLVIFGVLFANVLVAYIPALLNFWGTPLDSFAARFTLPIWLCLAFGGGWFISKSLERYKSFQRVAVLAIAVMILSITAETNASHSTTDLMVPSRAERWFVEFAKRQDRTTTLFVSKSNIELIAYGYAAAALDIINKSPEKCVGILQSGIYNNIFILERSEFPESEEDLRRKDLALLGEALIVEEVARKSFAPGQRSRILRFIGYKSVDGALITPASAPPLPNNFKTDAERSEFLFSLYP